MAACNPKDSTWSQGHRRWLAAQQFPEPMSAFTYADLIATVDGLTARKKVLAERISELATDPAWWTTVARLRAFRGVDTLTALAVHLELGADWQRKRYSPEHRARRLQRQLEALGYQVTLEQSDQPEQAA